MTTAGYDRLAGAIASECRRLGAEIAHLEGGLISYAQGEITRDCLVKDVQTIDSAQQTLEDLARMLDVLSTARAGDADTTKLALAAIRQTSVRTRILSLADRRAASATPTFIADRRGDIDIW